MHRIAGGALLLLDYQKEFCIGQSGIAAEVSRRKVLTKAASLLDACREVGIPPIHVRVAFDDDYSNMTSTAPLFAAIRDRGVLRLSDPRSEICDELAPDPGEIHLVKGCVNPFLGTELAQLLAQLGINQLIVGGVATGGVVEATVRHGSDVGVKMTVVEDACADHSEPSHQHAISTIAKYSNVVRSKDVL